MESDFPMALIEWVPDSVLDTLGTAVIDTEDVLVPEISVPETVLVPTGPAVVVSELPGRLLNTDFVLVVMCPVVATPEDPLVPVVLFPDWVLVENGSAVGAPEDCVIPDPVLDALGTAVVAPETPLALVDPFPE